MVAAAVLTISEFHRTALRNAYALLAGAAETGKPHACWAHHMSVGGARTADQLVELGYFTHRLDAKPGAVETYRYRITAQGCAAIGKPYLMEETTMQDETTAEHATPDGEWIHTQAADALHALTPDEAALLARVHKAGGSLSVDYSTTRVDLTRKGLLVAQFDDLNHPDAPIFALTPLGEAAAALQSEMRIPSDDQESDQPEEKVRPPFTFKRGDRVHLNGAAGTVKATDFYPFVLFKSDSSHDLIKVYEHDLKLIEIEPDSGETEDDGPTATQELPAITAPDAVDETRTAPDADEAAELRADREHLLTTQAALEAQIVALREQLTAVKSALADDDGALPDDPTATIAALKLHSADQQATIDAQHAAILNMRAQLSVAAQETDILKRDVAGLKLQIAVIADSEMGIQHDWTHKTTPTDITTRTLAGWTPWHKEMTADGLFVVWERTPNKKPARDRSHNVRATGYAAPSSRPAAPSSVLQPDYVVIPADMPADPAYRRPEHAQYAAIDDAPEPAPLHPMSAVMDSFKRNLAAQFDANPLPQHADRPTA